jgi:hypothetical protein
MCLVQSVTEQSYRIVWVEGRMDNVGGNWGMHACDVGAA